MYEYIASDFYAKMEHVSLDTYGIIDPSGNIHTLGTDSKIIGRIFEMFTQPVLEEIAAEHGMILETPEAQTVYPDFIMMNRNDPADKIAIDVKTTYIDTDQSTIKFTLGSYGSYMRNNTKNIAYQYTDYVKHYVIGFVYKRNGQAQESKIYSYDEREKIIFPYYDVKYFIQEKYRIAGEKPGSGNTENIGSFSTKNFLDIKNGNGPFARLDRMCLIYTGNIIRNTDHRSRTTLPFQDLLLGFLRNLKAQYRFFTNTIIPLFVRKSPHLFLNEKGPHNFVRPLTFHCQHLCHRVPIAFFCAKVVEMPLLMPEKITPMLIQMLISSKLIFLPHGQAHICTCLMSILCQQNCLFFWPFSYVGGISANVWRIKVDVISFRSILKRLLPRCADEPPVLSFHHFCHSRYLITDFCNIRFGKTVRFLAKWYIKLSFFVKPNHTIEIGTIQEQKIKWISVLIKSLAHFPVIRYPSFFQNISMIF